MKRSRHEIRGKGWWDLLRTMCFVILVPSCIAQVDVRPACLDFGTTTTVTQWIVDVFITNHGPKKDFVLRTTFSHEYEVLFTSKTLFPDSTITMRVKFIPRL